MEEMIGLAMKNADMTATMSDLMRQNAEATKQMKELAELSHRIQGRVQRLQRECSVGSISRSQTRSPTH